MDFLMFDVNQLRASFEGDEEILKELIIEYLDNSNLLILEMRSAIREENREKFKISVHTLKGVISNFFAIEICKSLNNLEINSNTFSIFKLTEELDIIEISVKKLNNELLNFNKLI